MYSEEYELIPHILNRVDNAIFINKTSHAILKLILEKNIDNNHHILLINKKGECVLLDFVYRSHILKYCFGFHCSIFIPATSPACFIFRKPSDFKFNIKKYAGIFTGGIK